MASLEQVEINLVEIGNDWLEMTAAIAGVAAMVKAVAAAVVVVKMEEIRMEFYFP